MAENQHDISTEYQQAAQTDQRKAVKTHREPVRPGIFVTLAAVCQVTKAEQPVASTFDPDCAVQGTIDQQAGEEQDYQENK